MVRDSFSSYKIDNVIVIKNFLNTEGHQNPINGSKVTVILLKVRILTIGGASAVEGLQSTGLPHLVFSTKRLSKSGWSELNNKNCSRIGEVQIGQLVVPKRA